MINPRRHARLILATACLAALPVSQAAAYQVHSPDASDANVAAQRANDVDLRSPDARDAARGVHVGTLAPAPAPAAHHDGGDDTAIVLGGLLGGLVLVSGGGALIVARHRGAVRRTRSAAVAG
jgi:hypothetical protein